MCTVCEYLVLLLMKTMKYKNLGKPTLKVTLKASGEVVESAVLTNAGCEGLDVTIEQPTYSFQVQTTRCNLLMDGELVIESDSEDTQVCYFPYFPYFCLFFTSPYFLLPSQIISYLMNTIT